MPHYLWPFWCGSLSSIIQKVMGGSLYLIVISLDFEYTWKTSISFGSDSLIKWNFRSLPLGTHWLPHRLRTLIPSDCYL